MVRCTLYFLSRHYLSVVTSSPPGVEIFVPIVTVHDHYYGSVKTSCLGTFTSEVAAVRALVRHVLDKGFASLDNIWDLYDEEREGNEDSKENEDEESKFFAENAVTFLVQKYLQFRESIRSASPTRNPVGCAIDQLGDIMIDAYRDDCAVSLQLSVNDLDNAVDELEGNILL